MELTCNRTLYEDGQDELVSSWGLLSRPTHVCCCTAAYLAFVWIGPMIMKTRSPFKLKNVIMAYNVFQILMNGYLVWGYFRLMGPDALKFWKNMCCPVTIAQNFRTSVPHELMIILVLYYINKLIDLLDTVFFVLRKKQSQITFLHVYHHVSMVLCSYYTAMFLTEEVSLILLALNSFVHVVMYTYYFLAAIGPSMQKYLWWKKYITSIQITQFLIALVILSMTTLRGCKLDHRFIGMWVANISFFLVLFVQFYNSAYAMKKSKAN